ncbi:acyltransferase family protein [Gluconobacter morbifer]|uniref:Putative lipopolysaccharide modification acyltransferase n=1 Tax=Gluconobacter morbifer G707 TaxID=1088869 RepID=G6XGE4_9PROT|nr:acyltransferase [Gluconobacter morbifer]EHH69252.1 putative lipopolysaccharide modification acyltransferase [Gluconobacter morbifer G707]
MTVPPSLPSFENTRQRLAGPDLVRSLAIIDVLVCHDGTVFLSWWHRTLDFHLAVLGFFGVMMFFVLSGFLIGTIMLDLLDNGTSLRGWGTFLIRRWLRTLPAYYGWLLLVLVPLAYFGPYGVTWDTARHALPRFLTMTQNLAWPMVAEWFAVTWSLSVEEWFYLGFPVLLVGLLMCRIPRRVAFGAVLGVFFLLPLCWRLALPHSVDWVEVTSKIVTCRFDSIAWGVAAAWLYRCSPTFRQRWLPPLLLGASIVGIIWWSDLLPFPLWGPHLKAMAIFDVVGAGYALCMPAMMALRRLPPLPGALVRSVSTHSYGLYLCHLPLVLVAGDLQVRHGFSRWEGVVFTLITTLGGAALSWRLIERPCLKLRPRQA